MYRAARSMLCSAVTMSSASQVDSRLSWFQRVWQKARTDAASQQRPAQGLEGASAATLAHQLLKLHGGSAASFPQHITVALWDAYRGDLQSVDTPASCFLWEGTLNAQITPAELSQLKFFATLSQIGIDATSIEKDCRVLLQAAQGLVDAEQHPDKHAVSTMHRRLLRTASDTRAKLTPTYQRWFQRSLALPDGAKMLIDMRRDLLALQSTLEAVALKLSADGAATVRRLLETIRPVEDCLTDVLRKWSSMAWLIMDEMDWATTPAMVISQIVQHEAVHRLPNLEAVQKRMQPSLHRHAYAFFHPNVVGEPLAMVFVALTKGIASDVDLILAGPGTETLDFSGTFGAHPVAKPTAQRVPDTAIFYTISSTQAGLKGIELGNFLIKGVVSELQNKQPHIKQFSTLSPIPGYMKWLKKRVDDAKAAAGASPPHLHELFLAGGPAPVDSIRSALAAAAPGKDMHTDLDVARVLVDLFMLSKDWWNSAPLVTVLEPMMVSSVFHYLTTVKHRSRPLDPVAGFHLKNGATLHRINWLGNKTATGSQGSACLMVNYHYDLTTIASNAATYAESGHVAISDTALRQGDGVTSDVRP